MRDYVFLAKFQSFVVNNFVKFQKLHEIGEFSDLEENIHGLWKYRKKSEAAPSIDKVCTWEIFSLVTIQKKMLSFSLQLIFSSQLNINDVKSLISTMMCYWCNSKTLKFVSISILDCYTFSLFERAINKCKINFFKYSIKMNNDIFFFGYEFHKIIMNQLMK